MILLAIFIMNWNDLKYFLALAREGSVSGAGRLLNVKHTTVARRIQSLEQDLNTRLFDRSRQGYSMTQAAENLFNDVLELEDKIRHIDNVASNQDATLAGPLKLTTAHEFANRMIIPSLGKFSHDYPNIDLQLLMTSSLTDLSSMEADIAIRLTANPPDYLVGRELLKIKHGVYGTQESFDNLPNKVNAILFRSEPDNPSWTSSFSNTRTVLRVSDIGAMASAIRNGIGIGRMPCYVGDTEPTFKRLDLELKPSTWGVWMLNHVDLRATARVRACKEFLANTIENQRTLIEGTSSRYYKDG